MVDIGVERRDDHDVVLGLAAVDDAVAEHLALLVAERPVAALAHVERGHVGREDPVGGTQRSRPLEEPLA